MVILIGGSSHVGKTLLAQKMMEKTGFPYVSLDHIKMGLIRGGYTSLTVEQDAKMRVFMWPLVCGMIKTAVENGQNMIIEGCYVPGDWAKSFSDSYLKDIRAVFIVMSEAYIRENAEDIVRWGDVIEKRLDKSVDIDRLVSCSRMFEEWAGENQSPCLKIERNYSIEEILNRACALLGL